MVAFLHSNGQLRTERYGNTEKGCQKPAVQQKTTDDDVIGLSQLLHFNKVFTLFISGLPEKCTTSCSYSLCLQCMIAR